MEECFHTIAITGASSGLGRALALAYAHPGATLHLTAATPHASPKPPPRRAGAGGTGT